MTTKRRYGLAVTLVTVCGFFLRLWGIRYGLPHLYHPDEPAFVNLALAMGYEGNLNPNSLIAPINPGFIYYSLCFLFGSYFLIGIILGFWATAHDFAISILRDPSALYLIGRISSVLAGTLVIPLIYFIAKRLFHRRVGLVAALLFAPLYLPVLSSHFIRPEALQVLLATISFFFIARVFEAGKIRDYVFAGLFAGLATATKYPSGLMMLALFTAHLLRTEQVTWPKRILSRNLVMACAGVLLGFGLGAPFSVLEFWKVVQAFQQIGFYADPMVSVQGNQYLIWLNDLRFKIGSVPIALFFIAIIYSFLSPTAKKMTCLAFPLAHFIILSLPAWKNVNWQVVILPFFAILTAVAIDDIVLSRLRSPLARLGISCIIVISVTAGPLANVLRFDFLMTQTDTRTLAKNWVEKNIDAGTRIAMERGRFMSRYGPPLQESEASIARNYLSPDSNLITKGYKIGGISTYFELLSEATEGITYEIYPILFDPFAGQSSYWDRAPPDTIQAYLNKGVEYVITSGNEKQLPARANGNSLAHVEMYRVFYTSLRANSTLVKEFLPLNRPGPAIHIYKLNYKNQA